MREESLSKMYLIKSMLSKISKNNDLIKEKQDFIAKESERKYTKQYSPYFTVSKPPKPVEPTFEYETNTNFINAVVSNDVKQYISNHPEDPDAIRYHEICELHQQLTFGISEDPTYISLSDELKTLQKKADKLNKEKSSLLKTLNILAGIAAIILFLLKQFIVFAGILIVLAIIDTVVVISYKNKTLKIHRPIDEIKNQINELIKQFNDKNSASEICKISSERRVVYNILCDKAREEMKDKRIVEHNLKMEEKNQEFKKQLSLWEEQVKVWEEEVKAWEEEQRIWEEGKANFELEKADFYSQKENTIKVANDDITSLVIESEIIYKVLKNDMRTVLDERDWKHLDLIIYELETGRADTIKEALQQADLYIRHGELKQMITTATLGICSTIQSSIAELSSSISTSLASLNVNLSELRYDMNEINRINSKINIQFNEKLSNLISSQELTNSLIEKSNISSKKMIEDIARMKHIQNEHYLRNNCYYK